MPIDVDRSAAKRPVLRRIAAAWPFLLVAFLYVATSPFHAGLNNPNEMVRVYMTRALAEHGTFAIDPVVAEWGYVDDRSRRDGHLYASKAPLQSLVGVPAYPLVTSVLRAFGLPDDARHRTQGLRYLGSVVFGIAFAALLLAWCRRRAEELGADPGLGTAVGLGLALGTMLYPYALLYTGHLLAAVAAGGAYLAALGLARTEVATPRFRNLGILAGFAAGCAPFAEYPAALAAGPALVAAVWVTRGALWRAQLVGWMALGGALPFGVGLWAHDRMWGSPLKTGYSFLDNAAYGAVHAKGFFGVQAPTLEGFVGALFSAETGLFFFSPVLLLGLAAAAARAASPSVDDRGRSHRVLAVTAVIIFALQALFIASHGYWRGGWTLGPRYIIAVVPVLGLWVVEALASPALRPWAGALAAASIGLTGFAAAIYPHLSDVYSNPLASFVVPTYLRGETSYGIGHALGLTGHAANAVHGIPLLFALVYAAVAGLRAADGAKRRVLVGLASLGGAAALVFGVPEADPAAARVENLRVWGFWEPASRPNPAARGGPGRVGTARRSWRQIRVARLSDGEVVQRCGAPSGDGCRYGDAPWQVLRPENLQMGGSSRPVLFLHPVGGETVRAEIPVPQGAARAALFFGLSDSSVASGNTEPVRVQVSQAGRPLLSTRAGEDFGLQSAPIALTSTAPLALDLEVRDDGARVFGFDVDFYAADAAGVSAPPPARDR